MKGIETTARCSLTSAVHNTAASAHYAIQEKLRSRRKRQKEKAEHKPISQGCVLTKEGLGYKEEDLVKVYDSTEAKKKWLDSGRIDAKGLARDLPETAAALRSGELEYSFAIGHFFNLLIEQIKDLDADAQMLPRKHDLSGDTRDWISIVCILIALETITYNRKSDADEFSQDFYTLVCQRCLNYFVSFDTELLQEVYHEVVARWKPRIESMMKQPLESTCPIYNIPANEFSEMVDRLIHENFDVSKLESPPFPALKKEFEEKEDAIQKAIEGIINGEDNASCMC